ncbi:hypothetical protein JYQ77_12495, partial [Anaerobutyricum soehngenii]|uniref:hypothetical protein n=1 Tax=Anaerobutyricum soehngenii TaxID=105843 RepID=UPI001ADD6E47
YFCYHEIRKKIPQLFWLWMPLLLSVAFMVLARVIKGHPSYAFPLIYSIPIVFSANLYWQEKKNKKKS